MRDGAVPKSVSCRWHVRLSAEPNSKAMYANSASESTCPNVMTKLRSFRICLDIGIAAAEACSAVF